MNSGSKYICKLCNKNYKTYKSLWNHNDVYHKVIGNTNTTKTNTIGNNLETLLNNKNNNDKSSDLHNCKYCNKNFTTSQSMYRHMKHYCKEKNKIEDINELKKKLLELEKKIKISKKTINNNNGTINNGITNNIHINALVFENIIPKLNEKEKVDLLTGLLFKEIPHVELVRKIFTNEKFMEDRNTMITNLQTKTCMAFNKDTNKFGRGKPRSGP